MKLPVRDYGQVPDGEYKTDVTAINPGNTKYGDSIIVEFTIMEGNQKGMDLIKHFPTYLTEKNAWGKFFTSLGIDVSALDDDLDLDKVIGMEVYIQVVNVEGDQGTFSKIEKFSDLPFKKPGGLTGGKKL